MRGSCFGLCTPVRSSRLPLTHTTYSHTTLSHTTLTHSLLTHNSITHGLLTHNSLTHNSLTHNSHTHNLLTHNSHTQLSHTHNSLTQNSLTHSSLTHNLLTHSSLTHNLLTHSSLTNSFLTHNLLTHSPLTHSFLTHNSLTQTHSHTALSHTTCSRTANLLARAQLLCGRRGAWWHRPSLPVAGVALCDIDLHFVWQAWHLWHWLLWRAWAPFDAVVAAAVCVAGVALGDIDLHFVWQLMALGWLWWRVWWSPRLFVWQAWHLVTSSVIWRGRRGAWWHRRPFCVASVALGDIDFVLCGRRGIWWHRPSLCAAGVGLMALGWLWWRDWSRLTPWSPRLFVWQAWHLVTSSVIWRLFHTHLMLWHTTLWHAILNSFTYYSFPPSFRPMPFLFPAFPISFSHLLGDYWKKLICGGIRSFNVFGLIFAWHVFPYIYHLLEFLQLPWLGKHKARSIGARGRVVVPLKSSGLPSVSRSFPVEFRSCGFGIHRYTMVYHHVWTNPDCVWKTWCQT